MIKVQHEHEEQWWKGREALIEKQKARKEGQKKLDDVLYVPFPSMSPHDRFVNVVQEGSRWQHRNRNF
jgi:hypothetical protein